MNRRQKPYQINASTYDAGVIPGDDVNVKTIGGLDGCDSFCINLTAGEARIFASLDGTNFMAKQLVLCQEPPLSGDTVTSQDPVYVGKAVAGTPAWFFGDFKAIRIQQEGATAPVGVINVAGDRY